MPSLIQRVPRGLLDALNMKGTGDNPTALDTLLHGNFDVTDLYLADKLQTRQVSGTALVSNAATQNPNTVVPPSELWLVTAIALSVNTIAGNTIAGLSAGYFRNIGQGVYPAFPVYRDMLASTLCVIGGVLPRWLLMLPGDQLSAICNGAVVGGPASVIWSWDYYKLTF